MDRDIAIVGGGIAGSALAAVLAREGLDVVVLERQEQYEDRVRGEFLVPWGVAEAQRLGLLEVLVDAGGAVTSQFDEYGDGSEPGPPADLAVFVEGAAGALNMYHPDACAALAAAAVEAGATVLQGVTHVEVAAGSRPSVAYQQHETAGAVRCRLVVGADGRSSRVRRQVGIALERAPERHLIAGMLVEGIDIDASRNLMANGEDAFLYVFPQGPGRARLYLCPGTEHPQRFAGPHGAERFLETVAARAVPDEGAWAKAVPAGPCRTFPADDTWTDRPFAEGVVLIGDAGGHNNPLIGQGQSLALRDVRSLADLLLDGAAWDEDLFVRYGVARAERLRRTRFLSNLDVVINTTFGDEGRALRKGVQARLAEDESLQWWLLAELAGPDSVPEETFTDDFRRRLLGPAA